jgi:hypothetical protein
VPWDQEPSLVASRFARFHKNRMNQRRGRPRMVASNMETLATSTTTVPR